jgi:hypothetical protein
MALPKIDTPVFDLYLPLSKNKIKFRPFLVKEQRNLLMALESNDKETIEKNIKQVLHNCTLTEKIDIDTLPIVDVEFYFLNLRARSVGEVVDNKYRCENLVNSEKCNNLMDVSFDILDIKVEINESISNEIKINESVILKLNYPKFSIIGKNSKLDSTSEMVFNMIIESIDYIYDGEQFFYAKETPKEELVDFIESLNMDQFNKIQEFFENLPSLTKKLDVKCKKCGFEHVIFSEGLESFFV